MPARSRNLGIAYVTPQDKGAALIWCLLGQVDQCFEGIAVVFKGFFNALWYLIWHVGACYARKLQQVLIHQVPTRPFYRRRRLYRRVAVYLIRANQRPAAMRGLLVRRNWSLAPPTRPCEVGSAAWRCSPRSAATSSLVSGYKSEPQAYCAWGLLPQTLGFLISGQGCRGTGKPPSLA
jgi:hypothetical protein